MKTPTVSGLRSAQLRGGLVLLIVLGALLLSAAAVQARPNAQAAPADQAGKPVAIYFFWGNGCPHCAKAKPFLEDLARKYPNVDLRAYEVWYSEPNQLLFKGMAAAYGFEPAAVPTIFIGDQYWEGYAEQLAPELEAAVASCSAAGCRDGGIGIIPGIPTLVPSAISTPLSAQLPAQEAAAAVPAQATPPPVAPAKQDSAELLAVPLLGAIDLATQSLVMSTALIAFVDGFNPCSVWVLTILLA